MATYYTHSAAAPGGDGSADAPWYTLGTDWTITNGDTVRLKGGSVFRETFLEAKLAYSNLTIEGYGAGDIPVISGADVITAWTAVGGGVFSWTAGSNICGNVMEDGVALNWKAWDTNIATTALSAGSFTFDYNTFTLYVYPSSGTTSHTITASVRLNCIYSGSTQSGLVMRDLRFVQASRHAVHFLNRSNWLFDRLQVELAGGYRESSYHLGNGIEMSAGTNTGECRDSTFRDIFDSAVTSQLYNGSAASLSNHLWTRLDIDGVGLGGVEVSTQTASQTITNVRATHCRLRNIKPTRWTATRGTTDAYGMGVAVNGAGSAITTVVFDRNDIEAKFYGFKNASNTAGASGMVISRNMVAAEAANNHQGVRLANATALIESNIFTGFAQGVTATGTATVEVNINSNVFDGNARAIYRENANATFAAKNNVFMNQTVVTYGVSSGSGGFTGTTNATYGNVSNGGNYSSTGDVTSDPMLTASYRPRGESSPGAADGSPLIEAGTHLGIATDSDGRQRNIPPTIGAYEETLVRATALTRNPRT